MQLIGVADIKIFANPGSVSEQLLSPGAINGRHKHATSEPIWIAVAGSGVLLLADNREQPFQSGQVARFADGDIHGFCNTGTEPFTYISVTSPPIDFAQAYKEHR